MEGKLDAARGRAPLGTLQLNSVGLPIRSGAMVCWHFVQHGYCSYGAKCFKSHPEDDLAKELAEEDEGSWARKQQWGLEDEDCEQEHEHGAIAEQALRRRASQGRTSVSTIRLNSVGLPLRSGAEVCSFFLKQGWCKYGASCYKDHPEEKARADTGVAETTLDDKVVQVSQVCRPVREFQQTQEQELEHDLGQKHLLERVQEQQHKAELDRSREAKERQEALQNDASASTIRLNSVGLPLRSGAEVCSFFLKQGWCKYGASCYNDHPETAAVAKVWRPLREQQQTQEQEHEHEQEQKQPLRRLQEQQHGAEHDSCREAKERQEALQNDASASTIRLNSVGLPLRSGAEVCSFFLKQGWCKYGASCISIHPEAEEKTPADAGATETSTLDDKVLQAAEMCCILPEQQRTQEQEQKHEQGQKQFHERIQEQQHGAEHDPSREAKERHVASEGNASASTIRLNSVGLPLWSGAKVCALFLNQGWCKCGARCYRDHPDRLAQSDAMIVQAPNVESKVFQESYQEREHEQNQEQERAFAAEQLLERVQEKQNGSGQDMSQEAKQRSDVSQGDASDSIARLQSLGSQHQSGTESCSVFLRRGRWRHRADHQADHFGDGGQPDARASDRTMIGGDCAELDEEVDEQSCAQVEQEQEHRQHPCSRGETDQHQNPSQETAPASTFRSNAIGFGTDVSPASVEHGKCEGAGRCRKDSK